MPECDVRYAHGSVFRPSIVVISVNIVRLCSCGTTVVLVVVSRFYAVGKPVFLTNVAVYSVYSDRVTEAHLGLLQRCFLA